MVSGALVSLPAGLVLDPPPEPTDHLIALAAAVLGLAAILAPWPRLSNNWLHAAPVVSTVAVAVAVDVISDDYAFFYVLIAMYAAFVIRNPAVLAAYTVVLTVALCAPLVYSTDDVSVTAHHILVTVPVLLISAGMVRFLRDTLERRESEYRGFATEAISLAERIRGRPGPRRGAGETLEKRLERLSAGDRR
jgi:hypothetical protein